jgi:hypothetical protein
MGVESWGRYAMTSWMVIVHCRVHRGWYTWWNGWDGGPPVCVSLNDEWTMICVMVHLVT